jgi:hypothetical protein
MPIKTCLLFPRIWAGRGGCGILAGATMFMGIVGLAGAGEKELTAEELSDLSIEDLMNVSVRAPAALTFLDIAETPASITTLTSEDIARTPARNLLDLIEIYVPGAIWMTSEEGPVLGIRGSISGWNNKYLLIVNGKTLNSKSLYGAVSELALWDLGDIRQVDIVRGPGSVTYGPSAVAGVIRILTQDGTSLSGVRASARYLHEYGSAGGSLSAGGAGSAGDFFAYASVQRTRGYLPLQYLGSNNNDPGYVGRDIQLDKEPLDYFADYQDIPQAKLFAQVDFPGNAKLWARYTQQGATWSSNEEKSPYNGDLLNQQGMRDRQFSASLSVQRQLGAHWNAEAQAGAMLFDTERRTDGINSGGPDDPRNFRYNFSESEYIMGAHLDYRPIPWLEAAFGGDAARESTGPGWWEGPETMRTGGDGIIVSGPDSRILAPGIPGSDTIYAGDGWATATYSAYFESKLSPGPLPTILLSGRADKNSQSQWLFSPRLAVIGTLPGGEQTLKGIIQRSEHRNESGELFIEDQKGTTPSYETLLSLELIHQAHWGKSATTALSMFYNDADVLAWDPEADRSLPEGNLRLIGCEAQADWEAAGGRWGASYALMEMVDWTLEPEITSSGVSYSDYDQKLRGTGLVQRGYGNSLNNWPNQSLKAYGDFPVAKAFSVHGDAQLFWDYQGPEDGLAALAVAAKGDTARGKAVDGALAKIRDAGAYGPNLRVNLSATYRPNGKARITAYVLNLSGSGSNARYAYDVGGDRPSPARVRFFREERAVGLEMGYSL